MSKFFKLKISYLLITLFISIVAVELYKRMLVGTIPHDAVDRSIRYMLQDGLVSAYVIIGLYGLLSMLLVHKIRSMAWVAVMTAIYF